MENGLLVGQQSADQAVYHRTPGRQGVSHHSPRESNRHTGGATEGEGPRPDVLLIMFDDIGFSDLGCYGSEIDTPNLDRLAATGHRYNNFHATTLCSPSRACLLSGRNHHAVGMRMLTGTRHEYPSGQERTPAGRDCRACCVRSRISSRRSKVFGVRWASTTSLPKRI